MTEALTLIEKELQKVRNSIQGRRTSIEDLHKRIENEEIVVADLLRRESLLVAALNKLKA